VNELQLKEIYIKKVETKKERNENKSWWQRSCSHISIANKNIKAAQAVLTVDEGGDDTERKKSHTIYSIKLAFSGLWHFLYVWLHVCHVKVIKWRKKFPIIIKLRLNFLMLLIRNWRFFLVNEDWESRKIIHIKFFYNGLISCN